MKIFKIRIGLSSINTFSEGPQILLIKKTDHAGSVFILPIFFEILHLSIAAPYLKQNKSKCHHIRRV